MFDFQLINSFKDIFSVRTIRNACREYMTRDTHNIGIIEQILWGLEYRKNNSLNIWCYIAKEDNKAVGYGLVRWMDDKFWLSGGLIPEARGRGLGEKIFINLLNIFRSEPLYLEVLDTNLGAYKLYQKLGFKKIGKKGNVITMQRKPYGRKE